MIVKAKKDESILIQSMGKTFRIHAIADNDDEANEHMRKDTDCGVIASFGPLVIMANLHEFIR